MSVFKIEGRVDALLAQPYRFRPFSARVVGIDKEIPFIRVVRGHHIISAIVVSDSGRINTAPHVSPFDAELGLAGQYVPYLFPVHEVTAMEKRNSGKILERAVHQIIIISYPAYAGVGMETRYHRVLVALLAWIKQASKANVNNPLFLMVKMILEFLQI